MKFTEQTVNAAGYGATADTGRSAGQGATVTDKLKNAVGLGSSSSSTEPTAQAGFSSSTNPVYGTDSPRSGVSTGPTLAPTRSRLSNAPPSASWGNAKFTSYEPAESVTQGSYSGSAAATEGAAGTGALAQSSSLPAQPESPVKRAVSAFEGRAGEDCLSSVSLDSCQGSGLKANIGTAGSLLPIRTQVTSTRHKVVTSWTD